MKLAFIGFALRINIAVIIHSCLSKFSEKWQLPFCAIFFFTAPTKNVYHVRQLIKECKNVNQGYIDHFLGSKEPFDL